MEKNWGKEVCVCGGGGGGALKQKKVCQTVSNGEKYKNATIYTM